MARAGRGLKAKDDSELTGKQMKFCEEYMLDYNASRAVRAAGYRAKDSIVSKAVGWGLLQKPHVKAYLAKLQKEVGEMAGLSKLKILNEHKKIAFTSIAHFHNTWIEKKAFENLTEEQKACIKSITHQTRSFTGEDGTETETEFVKLELYDKQKALDAISKMLGYDEPTRIDITTGGAPLPAPVIHVFNIAPPLLDNEEKITIPIG